MKRRSRSRVSAVIAIAITVVAVLAWVPAISARTNFVSGLARRIRPDLTVTDAAGAVVGEEVVITATVKNGGEAGSPATDIQAEARENPAPTGSVWESATESIDPLPRDSSTPIKMTLPVPAEAVGNSYVFVVTVDPANDVNETSDDPNAKDNNSDETNSVEIAAEDVPDLEVTDGKAKLQNGGALVTVQVSNVGGVAAPATSVSAEELGWGSESKPIGGLRAGKGRELSIEFDDVPPDAAGKSYAFTITVEAVEGEQQFNNNSVETNSIDVPTGSEPPSCGEPPLTGCPDLKVITTTAKAFDDSVQINVVIGNVGATRATPTRVVTEAPGWESGAARVTVLRPGERTQLTVRLAEVPELARGREYSFIVTVMQASAELKVGNNTLETNPILIPELLSVDSSRRIDPLLARTLMAVLALVLIVLARAAALGIRAKRQRRWVREHVRLEPHSDPGRTHIDVGNGDGLNIALRLEAQKDQGVQTLEEV
jgi:hypothetical protein